MKWEEKAAFIRTTHVSKFTHPSNDYESLDSTKYKTSEKLFITTASIDEPTYDIAYNNATLVGFAKFLMLRDVNEQETIFDKIMRKETDWLASVF